MYELKKIGKVFTSKFFGTEPSSYKKKNLPGRGLTKVEKHCSTGYSFFCANFFPSLQNTTKHSLMLQFIHSLSEKTCKKETTFRTTSIPKYNIQKYVIK